MEKQPNQEDSNKIELILSIAFMAIISGVYEFFYSLTKQPINQENLGRVNRLTPRSHPNSENDKRSLALILVINVGKDEIIRSLKENKKILENQGDALYRATQFLRICSTREVKNNDELQRWFTEENEFSKDEQSEYDVYLVQIELDEYDEGFEPNINPIDRLDAFRRLPNHSTSVKVSPRLPSKAYENIGAYSR